MQQQQQQGINDGAGGRGGPSGRGRGRGRGRTSDRPCRFFAQGHCRDGARCAFSHAAAATSTAAVAERHPLSSSAAASRAAAAGAARIDDDPFRAFKALSHRCLDRADQASVVLVFRDFLGSAIASLSGATTADRADTVLQMLCGVWRPPPSRGGNDGGAGGGGGSGLYGAAAAAAPSSPAVAGGGDVGDGSRAHLHLRLCMADFKERHQRGKLTVEVLCGRVFPLLRLLSHEALRESLRNHWVNPLYDNVLHTLDFEALAVVYERLLSGELSVPLTGAGAAAAAATDAVAAATAVRRRDGQWAWQPSDWLDLLDPPLLLLAELLERFQQPHHRELVSEPARRLTDALAALYDRHAAAAGSSSRVRRARITLRAVRKQLAHGEARVRILDDQDAAQRRAANATRGGSCRADRAAAERLRDPNYLPGKLRPTGCRHDNDEADFRDIRVVPTCGELLCSEWPYLPSNRPGSMPHLAHEPQRARLEVNFRLLRHDVVAPLATALQKFRKLGGLRWLQQSQMRQQQRAAATGRLELEGGSQLFVFRRVRVAGMAVNRQEGAYIRVTFEQPAMGGSQRSPEDWWRNTKRLSHGTLLCFWWEPPPPPPPPAATAAVTAAAQRDAAGPAVGAAAGGGGGGAAAATSQQQQQQPEPRLVVGVVARRDAKELAGRGSPDGRPMVGIRLVKAGDHEALLGAWLDWEGGPVGSLLPGAAAAAARARTAGGGGGGSVGGGGGGGGSEVVLVQEHNSFFAYEPVLKALQGITTIPLAPYIVPGAAADDLAADAAAAADVTATATTTTALTMGAAGRGATAAAGTTVAAAVPAAAAQQQQQSGGGGGGAELPAYWLDSPRVDLRHIANRERVMALPREEQVRVLRALAAVDLSRPAGQFPLEELLAASSLDRSQAEALRAALSQEVAVVQGPPGTGKTFLGVSLARVLLRNTRAGVDADCEMWTEDEIDR
ncbi:hypothetical protein PLESTF_001018400 [Pleodorina starrii]|nr:hypothetical protein PLESTF_001018400 [Pleodorina starrii]